MISEFRGKYYFLSNFYSAPITYEGITYRNNESAFQSMKTLNIALRMTFAELLPNEAKYLGRRVPLRSDWEMVKDNIMYEIVKAKFEQNQNLKDQLLETNDEYLIEGNSWFDTYWGMCNGSGKNKLGEILMRVRLELR